MFLFIRIRLKQEIGFQEQEREKSRVRLAVSVRRKREPRRVRSPMARLNKELELAQGDGKFSSPALECRNNAVAMGRVTSGAQKE